jgi:hypothetical protein
MNPFRLLLTKKPTVTFYPTPRNTVPPEHTARLEVEFQKARANLHAMGIFEQKPLITLRDR